MTKPNPLDSILGSPARGASVISSVAALAATPGHGVTAVIQRTDLASGRALTELVRLNARGDRRAAVTLSTAPDEVETAITSALVQGTDLGVIRTEGTAPMALTPPAQAQADAVAACGVARLDQICGFDGGLCVLGRSAAGPAELYVLPNSGTPTGLPLDALELGAHRQIGECAVIGSAFFASVADPVAGFDLYRWDLTAPSEPPTCILTRGAQRFAVNAAIAGTLAHDKGLLLGTAALAGPRQPAGYWGPELLLVQPGGSWDMLIGQPRFSPQGLLLPASGLTAGLGEIQNAAIRAMASDGELTIIALQDYAGAPEEDRVNVALELSDYSGAVRLFASFDLQDWTELPHELPRDIGAVTHLHVTEEVLFVGHEAAGADAVPVSAVPLGA